MAENTKTLYLVKANDNLISHCKCARALIGSPAQVDCPWCGCGWLFVCSKCRKAFTFARAEVIDLSWDQLAHKDLDGKWGKQPIENDVFEWIEFMKILLKDIEAGKEYVYLDGWVFSTEARDINFEGWHAQHNLHEVPQAEALENRNILQETLGNTQYWQARKLPEE